MQLYQSLQELAGPWENVIIKDNGCVIVIGNHCKWALGYGWGKELGGLTGRPRRKIRYELPGKIDENLRTRTIHVNNFSVDLCYHWSWDVSEGNLTLVS